MTPWRGSAPLLCQQVQLLATGELPPLYPGNVDAQCSPGRCGIERTPTATACKGGQSAQGGYRVCPFIRYSAAVCSKPAGSPVRQQPGPGNYAAGLALPHDVAPSPSSALRGKPNAVRDRGTGNVGRHFEAQVA
ncbi:hypothetical protein B0I37DRAFT_199120 [Chaetomium sp. MPI-CAGE-AT-0009]|nr:hypothetical protein B0I37DRAFT_199120 [Chaetomium sp. MPI-CAGE-AT-0009]